jgi:hypothetical protein
MLLWSVGVLSALWGVLGCSWAPSVQLFVQQAAALPETTSAVAKYYDFDKDFRLEPEPCSKHYEMYDKWTLPLSARGWKLHEIGRPNQPEDDPHRKWEPPPSAIMHDGWCKELTPHAASLKLASASRQHILDPFAFASISEGNQESFRRSENIDWRPVDLAWLSTCVRQDAEAGQAVSEAARDPVRNRQVESCHPPFAESD